MSRAPSYCDVHDLSELPALPKGLRYFDFIGGAKELRCFIAPEDMPRNKFMEDNEALFEECLVPIYRNNGIVVKQDASFALPGFYIVSHLHHYRSLDEFDEVTHLRVFFVLREIRKGMRERLGIQNTHIYYEERNVVSHNVHYWIVPINDIEKHPRLYNFDVKKYIEQFLFSQNKNKIEQYNAMMKEYIQDINLVERDNELTKTLTVALQDSFSSIPKQTEESVFPLEEHPIVDSEKTSPISNSGIVFSKSNLRCSSTGRQKFQAPTTVDFNVNGVCNLSCDWCWGPGCHARDELTAEQWKSIASNLQRLGTKKITITGGEPLLKKDLIALLKYLHEELSLRVTLSTNGTLLREQAKLLLPYVDDIGLPLDGPTKDVADLMRVGSSKYFDYMIENIRFLQKEYPAIDLTVRTVVSAKNAAYISAIGKTMLDYGVDPQKLRWRCYQITPLGVHKDDVINGKWLLSVGDFFAVMDDVRKSNPQFPHISALDIDMHVGRYFHIYPDGEAHIFVTGKDGYPCRYCLGNIEKELDVVMEKLKEFNLEKNKVR